MTCVAVMTTLLSIKFVRRYKAIFKGRPRPVSQLFGFACVFVSVCLLLLVLCCGGGRRCRSFCFFAFFWKDGFPYEL